MAGLRRFVLCAILLGLVAACPGGGGTAGGMPDASICSASTPSAVADSRGDPTCPDFGCGTNSATVGDGVVFDELDSSGATETTRGVRIDPGATLRDGTPVRLQVDRHFLFAVTTDGRETRFEGSALIGTKFKLSGITSAGDRGSYELSIDDYFNDAQNRNLRFWAGDNGESVPFYLITTLPVEANQPVSICSDASEPMWGPVRNYAIVFQGDRYDAVNKKVMNTTEQDKPWFNLACAGAAPAKMHLMRHTNAAARISAGDSIYQTTELERTAMLKMLTADYCGTGRSYTVDGNPLKYGDERHWYLPTPTISSATLPPAVCSIEALWTENGAACLDTPRRVAPADIVCPDGRVLPPCGGAAGVLGWERGVWDKRAGAHVHVISAN